MIPINLMHVVDALDAGGAERVAVNIVNNLSRQDFQPHLCTTRRDGSLASEVGEDVGRLRLNRRRRLDVNATTRLVDYIRKHNIQLLHAHGSALFSVLPATAVAPYPAIVWHAHYGRYSSDYRWRWFYRLAARRVKAVIAVSYPLTEWCRATLPLPATKIHYIPNFVCRPNGPTKHLHLPGVSGQRIINVANLRDEKDQLTLISAMKLVVAEKPGAHLFLVGAAGTQGYLDEILNAIADAGLANSITWLKSCADVHSVAAACDIGVLSSRWEGLPMALLEYGIAGLPVVATNVGQCSEVLDEGRAGIVVPAGDPARMAQALLALLNSCAQKVCLCHRLQQRVLSHYSSGAVMQQITGLYEDVLAARRPGQVMKAIPRDCQLVQ